MWKLVQPKADQTQGRSLLSPLSIICLLSISGLLLSLLPGCSSNLLSLFRKAMTFPYPVAKAPPLHFVLEQTGKQIQLKAICQGAGQWQEIKWTVTSGQNKQSSSLRSPKAQGCTFKDKQHKKEVIFSGWLVPTDELTQDKKIDLEIEVNQGNKQIVKTAKHFQVGRDGSLYDLDR